MRDGVLMAIVLIALGSMTACGGGNSRSSSSSTSSNVSISPTTVSVATSSTQQFTATVQNASNIAVTWQVNGVVGGNFTVGTITSTGLYTAPGTVPNPSTVTVTAISQADTTQTASAKVTITQGTTISVTVQPSAVSVGTGRSQQFTATVTPDANTLVSWQVNSVTGGSSTTGQITAGGLYTAPTTIPSPATVTITAVSVADTSKSGTAQVTIVQAVNLSVIPLTVTVPAAGQQTFTATENGQPVGVTWSLNCGSQSPGACGSISSAGVYTAPLSPPPGGDVILTATANDGSAPPAGAVITVEFSEGSLNGLYAFSFAGRNVSGFFAAAGSLSFDGHGNLSGGVEDINAGGASTISITGGTYQVGADGRGNAVVQTATGTEVWRFALVNHSRALAQRFDSGTVTAGGTLELQDPTQFNLAAIQGKYALGLSGRSSVSSSAAAAMAGAFVADGVGSITQGLLDANDAGSLSLQAVSGSYTIPSNFASSGRGTLTLGTRNFAFYVVDAARLKLLATNANPVVRGDMVKQNSGPFNAAGFRGGFAFTSNGSSSGNPFALGGTFTLDGAGGISSGAVDINSNGNNQSAVALAGTYSVSDAATGRTTATVTAGSATLQYVFYPQASGALNLLEVDTTNVAAGAAFTQDNSAFNTAAIKGHYALGLTGADLTSSPSEEDVTGQLIPNGGSAWSGTLDINDNGATSDTAAIQGSYSVSTLTGRGAGTISTSVNTFSSAGFNLYVINSNTVLFQSSDGTRVLTGLLQKQY